MKVYELESCVRGDHYMLLLYSYATGYITSIMHTYATALGSHVSDIRMVERVSLCVGALGPEQQTESRYQVTYHNMYVVSGRQLSYTPSIEASSWLNDV